MSDNSGRRAISFSLYGVEAKYSAGVCWNVIDARSIYPGWDVVVHAERGHYSVARLRELGAHVIEHDPEKGQIGSKWRFLTGDMMSRYECVIFRDADSRVNVREKAAVDEWLRSGKALHVMRDHPLHTNPVLAGMFGIRTGHFNFSHAMRDWRSSPKYGDDEKFLAALLWPSMKDDCLIHSSQPSNDQQLPFPDHLKFEGHVGERAELCFQPETTRVIFLSPEKYTQRRKSFLKSLKIHGGFLNKLPVEWFKATPSETCFSPDSFLRIKKGSHWWAATCDHLLIMERVLANTRIQNLFLFEDDATLVPEFDEMFWRAWASLPPNWKGLRLGWNPRFSSKTTIHPDVLNRSNPRGPFMHAMFWNRGGLIRAYDHFWCRRTMSIDGMFSDLRRMEPNDWYEPAKMLAPVSIYAVQWGKDQ